MPGPSCPCSSTLHCLLFSLPTGFSLGLGLPPAVHVCEHRSNWSGLVGRGRAGVQVLSQRQEVALEISVPGLHQCRRSSRPPPLSKKCWPGHTKALLKENAGGVRSHLPRPLSHHPRSRSLLQDLLESTKEPSLIIPWSSSCLNCRTSWDGVAWTSLQSTSRPSSNWPQCPASPSWPVHVLEGGEALEKAAQRSWPIPGNVQGQVGKSLKEPGLVEGVLAHGRRRNMISFKVLANPNCDGANGSWNERPAA